jgi:hypothetical protein
MRRSVIQQCAVPAPTSLSMVWVMNSVAKRWASASPMPGPAPTTATTGLLACLSCGLRLRSPKCLGLRQLILLMFPAHYAYGHVTDVRAYKSLGVFHLHVSFGSRRVSTLLFSEQTKEAGEYQRSCLVNIRKPSQPRSPFHLHATVNSFGVYILEARYKMPQYSSSSALLRYRHLHQIILRTRRHRYTTETYCFQLTRPGS